MIYFNRRSFSYNSVKRTSVICGMICIFLLTSFIQAHAFEPDDVTGLKLWLKADAITGVSDGAALADWDDSSTENNDASQTTPTNKPTYQASEDAFDGKAAVKFDGNDYLDTLDSLSFTDFTVCVIFKDDENVLENGRLIDHHFSNGFWLGRNDIHHDYWGGGVRESGSPFGRFVKMDDNQSHCLCSVRSGSTHTLYGDGFLIEEEDVGSTATSSNVFRIGQRLDSGGGNDDQYFDGQIAEIVVYNSALSDTNRADLEDYFETKYKVPFTPLGKLALLTPRKKEPTCNTKREGGVIYLEDEKHFYGCDGTDWNRFAFDLKLGEDEFTKLLLHFDGSGGTFSDSSSSNHDVTAVNGASQASSPDSPHTTDSNILSISNSSSEYVTVSSSSDWNLGSGDFTIDFWARPTETGSNRGIISLGADSNNTLFIEQDNSNALFYNLLDNGTEVIRKSITTSTTGGFPINSWYHVALVRTGNTIKVFLDGVENTSNAVTYSSALPNFTDKVYIGYRGHNPHTGANRDYFDGQIEELRISKGIARWTSNFDSNLPDEPY